MGETGGGAGVISGGAGGSAVGGGGGVSQAYKLVVVGGGGVGKSAITIQFIQVIEDQIRQPFTICKKLLREKNDVRF